MFNAEPKKHVPQAIGTVDVYPSASLNDDPMLYPGGRPETSFLLDGNDVFAVEATRVNDKLDFLITSPDGQTISLDEYLLQNNVLPMADRIPILGYGANMCPASIKSKFTKVGRADATIVPTVYAQLSGYDVVWSGGPGINGNFLANLYTGPETAETTATVGVNFLTPEQLLVMHATELAYDLTQVEVIIEGVPVKALVYAGVDDIMVVDGKPVAVSTIQAQGRTIPESSTRDLLEDILNDSEIKQELNAADITAADASTYVAEAKELTAIKGAKLARKKVVHGIMSKLGKSKRYELPKNNLQSWANPSTIPTYGEQLAGVQHKDVYLLPSQVIEKGSWPDEAKRELVLRSMGAHLVRITDLEEKK